MRKINFILTLLVTLVVFAVTCMGENDDTDADIYLRAETEAEYDETETETEPILNEYTEDDLYILSHIISAEAGNCSEDMMLAVGSVVLNRVADDRFPDTIEAVVFQTNPVQYTPTVNGTYWNEPTEGAVEVAKKLLEDGSQIDASVVWQANFPQGQGVYDTIKSPWGSVMYFCY